MKLRNQGFLLEKLKSSLQNCYGRHHDFVNRNGVTHNHGYVPLVVSISCSCPHSWLVTSFVARLTLWVQLVEQELLITSEHISSPSDFSGVRVTRTLVLFVVFCVVYPFSIYGFWLPLWYLQALLILYLLFLNSVWLILATLDYS